MAVFRKRTLFVAAATVALALMMAQDASAQRRGRSFFGTSRGQLATLAEVQTELKMTDEQKKNANEVNEKFSEERRGLFGGGDFASAIEKLRKLSAEASAKVVETLDDAQRKRLTEIFVQVNGPRALSDADVSKALKISDQQAAKLADIRQENGQARRDSFQDLQDASQEERREAFARLGEEGDKKLLGALTDEQREQFDEMKGKELDVDLSPLRRGRGNN